MGRLIFALGLFLFPSLAWATCPAASTDCPSPTYNQVKVGAPTGGFTGAGSINTETLYIDGVPITASAATVTVGTTTIAGGTTTRVLYDNAGILGEYTISGSGNVVMNTSPSISGLTVTGSFAATGLVTNA